MSETAVTSFIIRFTQEQNTGTNPAPWRGRIRHVQTDAELHFTRLDEALTFMARFVELAEWLPETAVPPATPSHTQEDPLE